MSGNAFADSHNTGVGGIIISTYQIASTSQVGGSRVRGEPNSQLVLNGRIRAGPGSWNMELRGSTTPRKQGVSTFYASNATVGETLDRDNNGRIAVTQLFYQLPITRGRFRAGLLDPSARLDAGKVAADEYTEFMADAFVHNPTIAFPSFTLGIGYQAKVSPILGYKLFVGSDSGLEDNRRTYHDLFDVDGRRGAYRKGVFAASELALSVGKCVLKGGIWYDTGRVARLNANGAGTARRHGLYLVGEAKLGTGRLQMRAGIADKDAQAASTFISAALQEPLRLGTHAGTLGLAVSRTGASPRLPSGAPIIQGEAYYRINVAGPIYVTPDIQYIIHPHFQSKRNTVVVVGVRVGLEF